MNFIVATDNAWGIGNDGDLLYKNPEDMKFFRTMTEGKVVVMGRKTLLSFPNAKPLKNRVNIVLSTDSTFSPNGVIVCKNTIELSLELAKYADEDIFVIGGSAVYELLCDCCDTAYITKIDDTRPADSFIPNMDERDGWTMTEKSGEKEYNGLRFWFTTYKNINIKRVDEL